MGRSALRLGTLAMLFAGAVGAQDDQSPHSAQFITVDRAVRLEVLDWGGSGRALVLLAGLGNTAHVFDTFAPKLAATYHVYGITRRGFGASGVPESGYSADRLGDDVLEVLETLRLKRAVLVGHSIAGEELSSVGSRHPERVGGLVYMDAGYGYAFYDRNRGDLTLDLIELRAKLQRLQQQQDTDTRPLIRELREVILPGLERDLREEQEFLDSLPATMITAGGAGLKPPASSLIVAGEQRFSMIPVPVLAFFAIPHDMGPAMGKDSALRAVFDAHDELSSGAQASAFENGVPSSRVIRLPHATHFLFRSNEADVLREIRAFVNSLPRLEGGR